MADTKPTMTSHVQTSSVRFVQSCSSSLQSLNSLPPDQLLILFTPAIPFANGDNQDNSHEDPFESLGRALSVQHSRVRHVPFVAKVGLTDLHTAWIRRAGAIIVVNCEPSLLSDTKPTSNTTANNVTSQAKFAAQVSETLRSLKTGSSLQASLSCIYMGGCGGAWTTTTGGYDNVIVCSTYSEANMDKATTMLMC